MPWLRGRMGCMISQLEIKYSGLFFHCTSNLLIYWESSPPPHPNSNGTTWGLIKKTAALNWTMCCYYFPPKRVLLSEMSALRITFFSHRHLNKPVVNHSSDKPSFTAKCTDLDRDSLWNRSNFVFSLSALFSTSVSSLKRSCKSLSSLLFWLE